MLQLRAGQLLGGKYRLIRPLGAGGMGAVWHAHHLTLNAPVALKVIDAADRDDEALQRFLAEARIAAQLRSPHVVQILDYGVDEGVPHIAMELLEGESLGQRLDRLGRLSAADTARIVQHIVRAIGRAHDAGIVHRDLKPENVFIVRNEDEELVKVLDFGIAKSAAALVGKSAAPGTRSGALLGTPYYMSPEQIDDVRLVDYRTDIWALGVLAFKCLVGKAPFEGDSIGRVVLAICSRPPPIPSALASVPDGFDAWFARSCARDPSARFDSARAAGRELTAICEGRPAVDSTRPVAAGELPVLPTAETRANTTAGSTTDHTSRTGPDPAPREPARKRRLVVAGSAVLALGMLAVVLVRLSTTAGNARSEAPALVREAGSMPASAVAEASALLQHSALPVDAGAAVLGSAPSGATPEREGAATLEALPQGGLGGSPHPASPAPPGKSLRQPGARAVAPARRPTSPTKRIPAEPSPGTDLGI